MNFSYSRMFVLFIAFLGVTFAVLAGETALAYLGGFQLNFLFALALYFFALGIGSLFPFGFFRQNRSSRNFILLFLLLISGVFSVSFLFWIKSIHLSNLAFSSLSYFLSLAVGYLSGFIISETAKNDAGSPREALVAVAIGTFSGLVYCAFLSALKIDFLFSSYISGLAGSVLLLIFSARKKSFWESGSNTSLLFFAVAIIVFIFCLQNNKAIGDYLINNYLSRI